MLVLQSTHDAVKEQLVGVAYENQKLQKEVNKLRREVITLQTSRIATLDKLTRLTDKWNDLVRQVNNKGGQAFLDGHASPVPGAFTQEEIRSMIQLLHPDKHNGSARAVEITKKLLAMRR